MSIQFYEHKCTWKQMSSAIVFSNIFDELQRFYKWVEFMEMTLNVKLNTQGNSKFKLFNLSICN